MTASKEMRNDMPRIPQPSADMEKESKESFNQDSDIEKEDHMQKDAKETEQSPEESLEALQKKAQIYWDQLLRLQAEFENFRKRAEKEKMDAMYLGREIIIARMIALTDVMETALSHAQNSTDINSLKEGFALVVQEFLTFLKSQGTEQLKTVGESFDPHLHEAVEQIFTDKKEEDNRIVGEIQKGYSMNGRLIRPARVKVAKLKPIAMDKEQTKESDDAA